MLTKKGKSTDSESSSLAGVLEMLQECNRSMQEQHKAQQKMLLEMIEKQRVAHEQEIRALKDGSKLGTEDSSKIKLQKPMLQKLASSDNVEHFWPLLRELLPSRMAKGSMGDTSSRATYW